MKKMVSRDLGYKTPCLVPEGCTNLKRYGNYRKVWIQAHGEILLLDRGNKRKLSVCHRCDIPACERLDHLFLGTASDNMRDSANKGRGGSHTLHFRVRFKFVDGVWMRRKRPLTIKEAVDEKVISHAKYRELVRAFPEDQINRMLHEDLAEDRWRRVRNGGGQ
jgi:hypothetical protein